MTESSFTQNGILYHIERSHRRFQSVSMKVTADAEVSVQAPSLMPLFMVKRILTSREEWFRRQFKKMQIKQKPLPKKFETGETITYLGKEYPLDIRRSSDYLITKVSFIEDQFIITTPSIYDTKQRRDTIKKTILRWYMTKGKAYLTTRANHFAGLLGYSYNGLKLKTVSTIWGSCSKDQNLSFNWKLMLTPPEIIDYVVIHEIAHLRYKHHQKSFWECVEKFDPAYKDHRRWLRKHSSSISLE